MKKKKWLRQGIGFALSLACLWAIATRIRWAEVGPALADFQLYYLLLGLVALSFGYSMRILRWSVLLRADGAKVSPAKCVAPFLVSITLNNVLPFRAGDVVRALVFPTSMKIRRVTATASLVLERLVDLLALLVCLALGLAFSANVQLPAGMKETVVFLSLVGSAIVFGIVAFHRLFLRLIHKAIGQTDKKSAAILAVGADFISGMGSMAQPKTLALCGVLSLLVWMGEAGLFLSVLAGFNLPVTVPAALIVMALATLSTLVPSAPGYVGTFHMAAFAAVSLFGVGETQAASFALVVHLALWIFTTIPGALAALLNPDLFRKFLSAEAV